MPPRPKILVVALELFWVGIARLPKALQAAGFEVGVLCFKDSGLAATRFCDCRFFWPASRRGGALAGALQAVVQAWQPDFSVAGDELTAVFLSRVFEKSHPRGELARLLKSSLGRPAALREATSKRLTMETARRLGIRVPASQWVQAEEEIFQFTRRSGFPVVLKKSFGWAGTQVAVCRDEAEAAAVFGGWSRQPPLRRRFRSWRKVLQGRELATRWLPADRTITVSQFIPGRLTMSQAAAFGGETLAIITAGKEHGSPEAGPSSVVRFIHSQEMRRATEKMIGAWGLSGFIGFDFIQGADGFPWLIECNPRPTPIAHLGARVGEDVCRALYCRLTGELRPRLAQEAGLVVAHFPREQLRDPNSPYLTSAFHDVPVDDPDLLQKLSESRG
ncbi:MAG: ATP-grasp domain-containing protein [Verrucomicrobiae bacterium]|nr:ATP-grasp domain-containing protein [Verrucomicrobiae bacterium]